MKRKSQGFALRRHADADAVRLEQIGVVVACVLGAAIGMMDETSADDAARQRHAQRGQSQLVFHRAIQCPTDHTARVGVQDDGQKHKLVAQPDIGDR